MENYLVKVKGWLSPEEHQKLIAEVDSHIEQEREFAVNSPLPSPETAEGGVYCEPGCHEVRPKYGLPLASSVERTSAPQSKAVALHFK